MEKMFDADEKIPIVQVTKILVTWTMGGIFLINFKIPIYFIKDRLCPY